MRRIALFFVLLCALSTSCTKTVKTAIPLTYKVESETTTTGIVEDAYIPATGTYHLRLAVKFLSGNVADSVRVQLKGLPSTISVNVDTFNQRPTYIADFVLTTNNTPLVTYPVTLEASVNGKQVQVYNFNLRVVPANCASYVAGTYNGSNACTARTYTYTMGVTTTGTANQVAISNFGGYGPTTTAYATLNCNRDSIFVASQNIGNGTILEGKGTFTGTGMKLWYSASSIPGGGSESCVATLTKQ
ncbi:MAG: hypothetical protein V4649_15670 [Bacteroidota bacterium]